LIIASSSFKVGSTFSSVKLQPTQFWKLSGLRLKTFSQLQLSCELK
jgi:hypothetical protein